MRYSMKILSGLLSLAAFATLGSCSTGVTCGEGTIEEDGVCTATSGTPPGGNCGAGSLFNPVSGVCEIAVCNSQGVCGICGPDTTVELDENDVPVCVGTGGGGPALCSQALTCPNPSGTKFMICGRLYDTETTALVQEDDMLPQKLKISFYDALAFANDATTAPEFSVNPDRCGRFVSSDAAAGGSHGGVTVPGTSFLVVGVDDASGDFMQGNFALTGVGVLGVPGGKHDNTRIYATRQATDAVWSAGVGGGSVIGRGVYLGIFIDTAAATDVAPWPGAPKSGVQLTVDGTVQPTGDFYFSDTDPLTRSTVVASQNSTGTNGAVLFLEGPLVEYAGTPNPPGCSWPAALAKTLPGSVFVHEVLSMCN
jgi:hypothetical protein